jgi:RimJ/RimL family protein N-acetyltransferase
MQLATDRLILRELVEDDWRPLHALESQPEVVRYLPYDVRSEDDARGYVDAIRLEARELPRLVFELAITVRGDDTMLGRCGMRRRSNDPRLASFWYVISPAHARKGYATEAARALLGYAFEELRLHRVHGECDPRNSSSARVMERLGMRREAEHVEDVWIKGEWCGTLVYAMLDREWTARR